MRLGGKAWSNCRSRRFIAHINTFEKREAQVTFNPTGRCRAIRYAGSDGQQSEANSQ